MSSLFPVRNIIKSTRLFNNLNALSAHQKNVSPSAAPYKFNISPKELELAAKLNGSSLSAKTDYKCPTLQNNPLSLSQLLENLTINDKAIRLPEVSSICPPLIPPSVYTPLTFHLPQTSVNESVTVGQVEEIMPLYAPEHQSQQGMKKHCIRDIVIRRKKMKKHKRKKERRRNRVSHQQRIFRDIIRRDEAFQTEMLALINEAKNYDPEKEMKDKLARYNNRPIPKFFRGKRLPEAEVIKEFRKRGFKLPGEEWV